MKRAFTIVEVLVVAAVLAILMAVLFPVVDRVRVGGHATKCLAQLRSLGVAIHAYTAEHDGVLPVMEAARRDKSEEVPVIDNTLMAYVDDQRVFACPSDPDQAEKSGTSYYWNSALSGQKVAGLNFLGLATDPGKIPLLVDKEGWHKFAQDRVNHLYADGHATRELRLFSE